ncbi:MAG: ferredoxin [Methylococcales bacterium]
MRTHNRHVLMCTGPVCTKDGILSQAMFGLLGEKIDARPHLRVKRTRTHCMVACKNKGPFLVVYPEGVWYRCPDEASLDRIVTEHLEDGREVSDLIFHQLGSGDVYSSHMKI